LIFIFLVNKTTTALISTSPFEVVTFWVDP